MAVDRAARNRWAATLEKQSKIAAKALEDLLVLVYEASQDGVSNANIAYNLIDISPSSVAAGGGRGVHPTGIAKKVAQGKQILDRRAAEGK